MVAAVHTVVCTCSDALHASPGGCGAWCLCAREGSPHAGCCRALQGRVACEINSGDELVATEMIFAGVLGELEPEEAVALLSALVFQVCSRRRPASC